MKCKNCGEIKSIDCFHPSDLKTRRSYRCIECKNKIAKERDYLGKARERHRINPEPERARDRARYEKREPYRKARAADPRCRKLRNASKRGLTLHQYEDMWEASKGICQIEGCLKQATDIDHDHNCCPSENSACGKCVRGLVCHRHNTQLRIDSVSLPNDLQNYINKYLERRNKESCG